jgi:SAM-dependent methyltransferase
MIFGMEKSEYKNMFELEESYWWYKGLHSLVKDILDRTSNGKNILILDAGCGTGGLIQHLNKHNYSNIQGVDFSDDAIHFCRKRGLSDCSIKDLNTWDPGKKYDAIISLDVLYHEKIESDLEVLTMFNKSLNKNGILILNLPAFQCLKRKHDEIVQTKNRYTTQKIKVLAEKSDFDVLFSKYRLPLLFLFIIIQKYWEKIFHRKNNSDLNKTSHLMNRLLEKMVLYENKLLLNDIHFGFGSSVISVFKKR